MYKICGIIDSERSRFEKRPFWMPALVGIEPVSLCLALFATKVEQLKLDDFFLKLIIPYFDGGVEKWGGDFGEKA